MPSEERDCPAIERDCPGEKEEPQPIETSLLQEAKKQKNQSSKKYHHDYYNVYNNNDNLMMNNIKEHLFEVPNLKKNYIVISKCKAIG